MFRMSALDEIRAERLKKLELLKARGIDPYPARANRTQYVHALLSDFEGFVQRAEVPTIAGRVMVKRGQGAILFVDVLDGTGKLQLVLKSDVLDADAFTLFKDVVDAGDFIEASGTLFVTEKGQESMMVTGWRMLSKSLLPLPDKYHGLQNEEERFRKRYLDILMNGELRALFARKAKFFDVTRTFLKEKGFLEVETPFLEVTTGGAEARPFETHHNDFDIPVYLRISVGELWQKRLLAAGFDKTFEIGRTFRNEGTSPNHLQEFTNMEFYWGYANYEDGMRLVEELYQAIAREVYGKTKFTRGEYTFDFADTWARIDYAGEIERQTGINPHEADEEAIKEKLRELGVSYEGDTKERLMDTLWKYCRKHIAGPAFVMNHPKLVSPLAKVVVGKEDTTQRFQPIIAGTEVGNGYSELNNPVDQRERFESQQELLARGDEEAMMADWEFVEMLEHGMPPACGFGFGERLFAILEDRPIRDTQLFPLMRPK